jgi:hypothetical protein
MKQYHKFEISEKNIFKQILLMLETETNKD